MYYMYIYLYAFADNDIEDDYQYNIYYTDYKILLSNNSIQVWLSY